MDDWKALTQFMYGDVATHNGFWYSQPLREIDGLNEEQLLWVPHPHGLCILWQAGHIACRERLHIGVFLQGLPESILQPEFNAFGSDWISVDEMRSSMGSVNHVLDYIRTAREESRRFIETLSESDFLKVPPTAEGGFSIAQWLWITSCHTALHIGRIQLLRAMLEGKPERAC
jgi:hypothetical protein